MSAPVSSRLRKHMEEEPKWLNPCGGMADALPATGDGHDDADDASSPLKELSLQLSLTVDDAAKTLKEFFEKAFDGQSETEDDLKSKNYGWLPELPQMDEGLPAGHLDDVSVGDALRKAYENISHFAVGVEQIVWDRTDSGDTLAENFKMAYRHLGLVLCELQTAMQRLQVDQPPPVSRDIMKYEVREESMKDFRDWLIMRDYVNALRYTDAVVKHFNSS